LILIKIKNMAIIKPFKGLRPQADLAAKVASLPYDVMNSVEAKEMAAGNPISFLHVSRAEIDLPETIDVHSEAVYQKAKENFDKLIKENVLQQDAKPNYYLYQQIMDGRAQTGLVACSSVADYFDDNIKKHEFTRPEKEQDRIAHMQALQAHVGPIFLTFPANNAIETIFSSIKKNAPLYDFVANDQISHTLWLIEDENTIASISSIFNNEIPFTYIADGHHRAASAAKVGKAKAEANPNHTGNEDYNFFLSVLFPSNHLAIMDYNRVVKSLNGFSEEVLLQKIAENFELSEINSAEIKPNNLHQFSMYLAGKWYQLIAKKHTYTDDPIAVLDVTILQNFILDPLLGIKDPRTDKNIDFVGGIRGLGELKKRVDSGEMAIAFALYPVSIEQLINIADSGNVMPPKSTWFEPKLRDGLLTHLIY
jgi:uncharacterized protein (DUF1015 family)